MRFSSLFAANLAVATLSIALVCGPGAVTSRAATPSGGGTAALPNVVVEAPKHVTRAERPKTRAVARITVSPRTSTTATPPASTMSPTAKLEKIANISGSCADGCVTSFKTGDAPWHGCSISGATYSSTCRNVGHYKTYAECTQAGLATGWRVTEVPWYCTSLALK